MRHSERGPADERLLPGYLASMKLLALSVVDVDLVDADVELVDGSRVRVRFDVSPKDDGSSASWEPDVFHDEPMPRGGVGRFVDVVLRFNDVAHRLSDA